MPERVVLGVTLSPDAAEFLRQAFPAGHELRVRGPQAVSDEDLAWATVLCCYHVPAAQIVPHHGLRWLHVPAAGMDPFVSLRTTRPDLRLTVAGAFNARAVAEHGLALLLALRRGTPQMVEARATGTWARDAVVALSPPLLQGGRAHVLGYGPVARALVDVLAAVGQEVTVYRRRAEGADPHVARFAALRELPERAGEADALFGVLPAVPETRGLIGRAALSALPRHALVVNLGRSSLVDTPALLEALAAGTIAGAALDVFDEEPLPAGSPLWSAPRLIVSPHVAGQFRGNFRRNVEIFLAEFERYLGES